MDKVCGGENGKEGKNKKIHGAVLLLLFCPYHGRGVGKSDSVHLLQAKGDAEPKEIFIEGKGHDCLDHKELDIGFPGNVAETQINAGEPYRTSIARGVMIPSLTFRHHKWLNVIMSVPCKL